VSRHAEPWPGIRAAVVRQAVAIGLTTGAYGLSFGAISTAAGLSVLQTCALSLLMFTGASQYALVSVIAGGGSALSGAATAILLGTRNALYGVRLSSLLRLNGRSRVVAAQLVIDESTAMAIGQASDEAARLGFWATGLSVFLWWNLGTLIGALGAHALSDPKVLGLDAAAPAAFLALLAPRMASRQAWLIALVAAFVALAALPITPVGVPVLLAALVAVIFGLRRTATDGPAG
jgi:predicted branched-subunit amino acid permease